jgi:putative superfamily III holin-X
MLEAQAEPSVGDLLRALARDTGVLMRQELQLASAEMTLKARKFAHNAALVATGGALALVGGLALVAALIAGLATAMPIWASALIVGLVITLAAGVLIQRGLSALKQIGPVPEVTISTLKADAAWAKEQIR